MARLLRGCEVAFRGVLVADGVDIFDLAAEGGAEV